MSGHNYWNGSITFQNFSNVGQSAIYATISADTGSQLTINGPIAGESADGLYENLNIGGGGSVELAGSSVNQLQGDIRVWEGTLMLNKTSVDPNTGAPVPAFQGNLYVGTVVDVPGEGGGSQIDVTQPDTAVVAVEQNNNLPVTDYTGESLRTTYVYASGEIELLNGANANIPRLYLFQGPEYSPTINIGSGSVLTLSDEVHVNDGGNSAVTGYQAGAQKGTSGASPAVQITGGGSISLGTAPAVLVSNTSNTVTPYRQWTINTPELASTNPVLNVAVPISGGADAGLVKLGTGTVEFSADNAGMLGNFFLNNGYVEIAANDALGSGGAEFGNSTTNMVGIMAGSQTPGVTTTFTLDNSMYTIDNEPNMSSGDFNLFLRSHGPRGGRPPAGQPGLQRPGDLRLPTTASTRSNVAEINQTVTFTGTVADGDFQPTGGLGGGAPAPKAARHPGLHRAVETSTADRGGRRRRHPGIGRQRPVGRHRRRQTHHQFRHDPHLDPGQSDRRERVRPRGAGGHVRDRQHEHLCRRSRERRGHPGPRRRHVRVHRRPRLGSGDLHRNHRLPDPG